MNTFYFFLMVGGILVIIGIGAAVSAHQTRKRQEGFGKIAEELGLTYSPTDTLGILTQFAPFQLFNQGRARIVSNVITAEAEGIHIAIFDYQYTTGGGKHQHTHRQSIVGVHSVQLQLPAISMRPEHLFDALANLFGSKDIDFPENSEFSRAFKLISDRPEATRQLFQPPVLDFFTARQGTYLEAAHDRFIYFRRGRRIDPRNIKDFLSEGFELHSLFAKRLEI